MDNPINWYGIATQIREYPTIGEAAKYLKTQMEIINGYHEAASKQPKKEYEVLSIKGNFSGSIYNKAEGGIYLDKNNCGFNWTIESTDLSIVIYSVKRLSDGEVFVVGRECEQGIIKEFECSCGGKYMWVHIIERGMGVVQTFCISMLKQIKEQPVFITEDGVGIYSGDKVWMLSDNQWLFNETVVPPNAKPFTGVTNEFKYFSTKEAAERYVVKHKPCMSISEFVEHFKQWHPNTSFSEDAFFDSLKSIAKDKITRK